MWSPQLNTFRVVYKSLLSFGSVITLRIPPTVLMSETPTLCEPSINERDVVAPAFVRCPDTRGPGFPETPTPANEPVEVKPVSWDGPHDKRNPQNWSASRKWLVLSVNGIVTVNVYVQQVMFSAVTS